MNGTTDSLSFAWAGPSDEAGLRALLRANPMRGAVNVCFTHEPDYFAGTGLGGAHDRTLIARERGRIVALGRCIIQPRWLNGAVRPCAYLGELRLDASVQGRADILRRGYAFLAAEYARQPADFCFTSIVSDNHRARRVLEHGLPGLPRYEPLGAFHTLLLRPRARAHPACPAGLRLVSGDQLPPAQLVEFLNQGARARQLGLHWTTAGLSSLAAHGLRAQDFLVLQRDDAVLGCAAVWDQRAFRQIVVEGYAPWLALNRPLLNLAHRLLGLPRLPVPGSTLSQAFLSPLVVSADAADYLPLLITAALAAAARRKIECLTLGFSALDPLWPVVARAFPGRLYSSQLYAVQWAGSPSAVSKLDARPCLPELALL